MRLAFAELKRLGGRLPESGRAAGIHWRAGGEVSAGQ
jgi:hypothetical protein